MEEVNRTTYLERLMSGKDRTDTVKIITGMRRCGKTTLMKQFMSLLKEQGVPGERMIYLDFESRTLAHITDYLGILDEIDRCNHDERLYVFMDEVQNIPSWERAVNSLQVDYDADIYIIGSNAYLLSGELSTLVSGRYRELCILPLSFAEYLELHPGDKEERFQQYVSNGSLPMIDSDIDEQFMQDHLTGLFNTILVKDVLKNCRGGDSSTLMDICKFLFSNIGNITSANNIASTIKKDKDKVRNYLDALQKAFLIYKAERYDIRGKKPPRHSGKILRD